MVANAASGKSDRISTKSKISAKLDNPMRRKATPTDWAIKGELILKFNHFPEMREKYRFENKFKIIELKNEFKVNFTGNVFTEGQNIFKIAKLLQININSYVNKKIMYFINHVLTN